MSRPGVCSRVLILDAKKTTLNLCAGRVSGSGIC